MEFDCLKATLEETASVRSQFRIPIDNGGPKLAGFAGWFDVHFRVRFELPQKCMQESQLHFEILIYGAPP